MLQILAQQTGQLVNVVDIQSQTPKISAISSMGELIELGAGAVLVVGGLAVLVYLLMGGLNWITAGGDKGKIDSAKSMITHAIIGIAILASVFALYSILLGFFGLRDRISIVGGGSSGGGTGGGSQVCAVGTTASDGGAGRYCQTSPGVYTAATVKCYGPGKGVSAFSYNHWEPCSCITGSMVPGYTFNCTLPTQ